MTRTTRKIVLAAIVAMLAIGTPAALALNSGSGAANDAAMAQETTTAVGQETTAAAGQQTTTAGGQTADVTFTNQTSNGTAVVVERVVLPEGGYVVIHEAQSAMGQETTTRTETTAALETTIAGTETADAGERQQQYTAGPVVGNSTYLEPGVHENVAVRLNRPLRESQVLIAMPHRDTNGNQQYDFPAADDPYVQDGQPVTDWAYVTVEGADNQTTTAAGAETTAAGAETTTAQA